MANELGYIVAFDGVTLTTDANIEGTIGNTDEVNSKIEKLDNGTVINFDGTQDASVSPGTASVFVKIYANVATRYNAIAAKKKAHGIVTKEKISGGYETCNGILEDVLIRGVAGDHRGLILELRFNFDSFWVTV